ncbi:MAG: prolipoprotein diacylglyceryl transferase [Candidatus Gracilibacteria bacterium]
MFAGGVVLYYFLTRWLWKREKLGCSGEVGDRKPGKRWPIGDFDSVILFLFVGLVVGARLGEVFFYNFGYYSSAGFWEIFKIWEGGLSSHGATIGLVVAYTVFWGWRRRGWRRRGARDARGFWFGKYLDVLAICMPLVAGFVRIGNFFNSEIVGRATDSVFGVVFAMNGENFARHPVQLYEGAWAWVVFAVVFGLWLVRREGGGRLKEWARPGWALFLFIGLYFAGRFVIEFFKEYQLGVGTDGLPWGMTMGQALSVVPVVVAGAWFAWWAKDIVIRKS